LFASTLSLSFSFSFSSSPLAQGLASYGQEGVERVVQILKDEMVMNMRLIGAASIKDLTPDMVITRNLSDHHVPVPMDHLSQVFL
jgi:L-lactate dehydrogenase (cytochrome)